MRRHVAQLQLPLRLDEEAGHARVSDAVLNDETGRAGVDDASAVLDGETGRAGEDDAELCLMTKPVMPT